MYKHLATVCISFLKSRELLVIKRYTHAQFLQDKTSGVNSFCPASDILPLLTNLSFLELYKRMHLKYLLREIKTISYFICLCSLNTSLKPASVGLSSTAFIFPTTLKMTGSLQLISPLNYTNAYRLTAAFTFFMSVWTLVACLPNWSWMVCSLKLRLSFLIISIATGTKTSIFSPYFFSWVSIRGRRSFWISRTWDEGLGRSERLFPIGSEEGERRKCTGVGFSVIRDAVLGMHILRGSKFCKVKNGCWMVV